MSQILKLKNKVGKIKKEQNGTVRNKGREKERLNVCIEKKQERKKEKKHSIEKKMKKEIKKEQNNIEKNEDRKKEILKERK